MPRQHLAEQTYDPTTISEEADNAVLTAIDPSVLNSSTLEVICANQTSAPEGRPPGYRNHPHSDWHRHAASLPAPWTALTCMSQAIDQTPARRGTLRKNSLSTITPTRMTTRIPESQQLRTTHVAGIAAANAPELRGVAPNAQIIAAKVAGDGSGIQDRAVLMR